MTREDMYVMGCLLAVNKLIESGSSNYGIKMDGKWQMIPWTEIEEWLENQYEDEQGGWKNELNDTPFSAGRST